MPKLAAFLGCIYFRFSAFGANIFLCCRERLRDWRGKGCDYFDFRSRVSDLYWPWSCGIYSFILMFFTLHIFSGECTWFCIFIQYIVIDDDLTVIWPLTNSYDNAICDLNWMNVIQFMGKMLFVYHGLKLKRVIINASYLQFYLEYYIRLR